MFPQYDQRTPTVVHSTAWGDIRRQEHDLAAALCRRCARRFGHLGFAGDQRRLCREKCPRLAFEYGKLVDQWSQLGLPLMMFLTAADSDARTQGGSQYQRLSSRQALHANSQVLGGSVVGRAPRPNERAVCCGLTSDGEPHEFPNVGYSPQRQAKHPQATARPAQGGRLTQAAAGQRPAGQAVKTLRQAKLCGASPAVC